MLLRHESLIEKIIEGPVGKDTSEEEGHNT